MIQLESVEAAVTHLPVGWLLASQLLADAQFIISAPLSTFYPSSIHLLPLLSLNGVARDAGAWPTSGRRQATLWTSLHVKILKFSSNRFCTFPPPQLLPTILRTCWFVFPVPNRLKARPLKCLVMARGKLVFTLSRDANIESHTFPSPTLTSTPRLLIVSPLNLELWAYIVGCDVARE